MSTPATRGSTRKRDEPAGHMEGKHGDDLDDVTGASEFEAFVREQFKKLLEGQKDLQDEVQKGENCVSIVEKILEDKFGLDHIKIERAHPDCPRNSDSDGVPQHILFKLNSYADKVSIMKAARRKLQDESYYFTDDLTVTDLQEKRKWMEKVRHGYKEGKKYRFYNGYWRDGQGKVVSFD
ncbi:Hypp8390 [Branchiostoma lanceolatum]|uniref:Hypp8390 protein n=1 Tax=Branchiostoma lanceolatum TaxID=7740 RepID=A0A8J9Z7V5_BRALA|nr:Hypp8390 [Branchiostoma lanceolatum]